MSRSDVCECLLHSGFSLSKQLKTFVLFTGNFAIKAGECDGKGLHGTHGVVVVQRENVISYSSKLHYDVVHWKKKRIVWREK